MTGGSQTFQTGEVVETKIVFRANGGRKNSGHWIDAQITKFNPDDGTYDIFVPESQRHRVNPHAVHVPASFLRKIANSNDLNTIIAMGFPKAVAQQYLEMARGNLDLALSCLYDEQHEQMPDQRLDAKKNFRRQMSSVYATSADTISKRPELRIADPLEHEKKGAVPKENEFDYLVKYTSSELGFEIRPAKNDKNAMVGGRASMFAHEHIFSGSLILQVGDHWLLGLETETIRRIIADAIKKPPVTFRFRGKSWMKEEFSERGTLKILVVAASALYKGATHVTVRVNDALLSTDKVKKSKEPSWEEVMMWRSFRAGHNKHAIIRVWQYNRFTSNVCVGRGKLKLPTTFDKCFNDTVELKSESGGTVGVLMVRTLIQRNRRHYRRNR